jgi:hypothetical protein
LDVDTNKTLHFLSKFEAQSNPLPATSAENAVAFFQQPQHLSFGESMPSEIIAPTPSLVEDWLEACQKLGMAAMPNPERDFILRVRTAGIKIPGLTVEWSAHIGTTLIQHEGTMLPTLEFVLIKDETSARGIRPLQWMFEQATSKRRSTTKQRDTRFHSRISIRQDGEDQHALFCDGTMEMRLSVPSVLRKAMGKDKSKHEARISKLITRQIEKDMAKAVSKWHSTYAGWLSLKWWFSEDMLCKKSLNALGWYHLQGLLEEVALHIIGFEFVSHEPHYAYTTWCVLRTSKILFLSIIG